MEKLCERYGKKKTYIFSAILAFIILLAVSGCAQYVSRLFRLEDTTFKLIQQHHQSATFQDQEGNLLEALIEPGQLNSYTLLLQITYLGKTITYNSLDFDEGIIITLSDGSIYKKDPISIHVNKGHITNGKPVEPSKPVEVILINKVLDVMRNNLSTEMFLLCNGLGLVFILVRLMNILYPEVCWTLKHFMDVEGGEPSDFYIFSSKIGGYIFIGFAFFIPIYYLISIKS
ncbi:DUF6199 family natural product biosynthesis protein [Zhenhengia yiwuensis]|uniref:DUF6199 family natural product biosynthesis protein n=1 Tax=Zhenhengia yiwuensis TaxID=2763666 RepID=UPI002913EB58|nr:DUF6199 family natural product biosynthesis protein [Zhenhengia yiwuensis]MDU6359246.1 hypothetical protein [Clostridiales bacterium]MDY3368621.1 hypothetical protein [Zhenhengia yiwuensis]